MWGCCESTTTPLLPPLPPHPHPYPHFYAVRYVHVPKHCLRSHNCAVTAFKEQSEEIVKCSSKTTTMMMTRDVRCDITDALLQCTDTMTLTELHSLHGMVLSHGLDEDTYVDNLLIGMYKNHNAVDEARKVFDTMPCPSLVSWNSMISAYVQCGRLFEALHIFYSMQLRHVEPNDRTFTSILRVCIVNPIAFKHGKAIYTLIIASGYESFINVGNALLNMYAKCGTLDEAIDIFKHMHARTVTTWTTIISAHTEHKKNQEAIELFKEMQNIGVEATHVTFINILKACINPGHLTNGFWIHACVIDSSYSHDASVTDALVCMYGRCNAIYEAETVFNMTLEHNAAPWNALMIVYTQLGYDKEAYTLFQKMLELKVNADQVTLVSVLAACTSLEALEEGKVIHMYVINNQYEHDIVVGTALVNLYGKCGSLWDAQVVFDRMQHRDVIAWASIISAYSGRGHVKEALRLIEKMERGIMKANGVIFLSVLGACRNEKSLGDGRSIHAHIVAGGLESDNSLAIALVDMYGKCKSLEDARIMFNKMGHHCVVSWTAMITACIQHENLKEALDVYQRMQLQRVQVDEVTLTSLLGACSGLGNLVEGRAIHEAIVAAGFASDMSLGNALINMYHKCGALDAAQTAFCILEQRNVVSWTIIISAYAHHGHGKEAVDLFLCMQSQYVDANDFTFVSLLSACNHAGLMDEAHFFFNAMINDYKLDPTVEHYSCMIDLLGRAGRLEEAEALISKLPIKPDAPIWTSLISACKSYGDAKRGQEAAGHTPLRPSSYVLLANVYAGSS